MEEWKDIVGYEGHYQISSDGRLRSMERKVKHKTLFNGQTKHSRILKLSISKVICSMYSKKTNIDNYH